MSLFHSCHIKTHQEAFIPNNKQYQTFIRKVATADALTSIQDAHEQILAMDPEKTISRRQSMEEFRIPLKRLLCGLYTIEVHINHHPMRFIIDTGAQISGIMTNVAKRYGLTPAKGTMNVSSVGGLQKEMSGWVADCLQFGALELFQYPLITLEKIPVPLFKIDGIIGWDILSTLDFEIDDIDSQFIVLKNRFRFSYCNLIQSMFPILILLDKDNKMHLFGMDSGATTSWIHESLAKSKQLKLVKETKAIGIGIHGVEEMHLKVFDGCEFYLFKARIKIKNVNTGRTDVLPGLELDGVLGNEIFRGRRIRFINSKGMVLLA